jgi:hypothetical protein
LSEIDGKLWTKTIHKQLDTLLPLENVDNNASELEEEYCTVFPTAPPAPVSLKQITSSPVTVSLNSNHQHPCKILANIIINMVQLLTAFFVIIYGISIIQHVNFTERAFVRCCLEKKMSYFPYFIKCESPSTYYQVNF